MPNFSIEAKLDSHFKDIKNVFKPCQYFEKLPQSMKLAINQIRVICKTKTLDEKVDHDEIEKLISGLCKNIQELVKEK